MNVIWGAVDYYADGVCYGGSYGPIGFRDGRDELLTVEGFIGPEGVIVSLRKPNEEFEQLLRERGYTVEVEEDQEA